MLRRLLGLLISTTLAVQAGCGGGSPPPATTAGPAAPPGGPVAPVSASVEEAAAPAVGDVYATIPDSVSGATVIRVPKLLVSPVGASEAAVKITERLRSDYGLESSQIDEVILVFVGGSPGSSVPSAPYGGREGSSPYGPPSGSPYGPNMTAGTSAPAAASDTSGGLNAMLPAPETTVRIIRANVPIDEAKVRSSRSLESTEQFAGAQKIYRSTQADSDAVCFFDPQSLIIGREAALQSYFNAPAAGASSGSPYGPPSGSPYGPPAAVAEEAAAAPVPKTLGETLREAPPEFAIFGAKKSAGGQPSVGALMPTAAAGSNVSSMLGVMASAIPEGTFAVDLASGAKLTIDIAMPNADGAQQLWSTLQGMQGMIGMAVGMQRNALSAGLSPEQQALQSKGYDAWDQFAKTMKVERGGENNQHVLISGSLDQPMVESLAGTLKRDLILPPGSDAARRVVESQLKQLGIAAHTYLSTNNKLPTAATMSADGKPLLSWRVSLLPFLGQKELFDQFKQDEAWDSEHNKALVEKMPSVFAVPGISEAGKTTIVAPVGDGTVLGHKEGATLVMASDGPSNTILLVQANAEKAVTWTAPDDLAYDAAKPTEGLDKAYSGVFLALWLDGQVHTIALNTATDTAAGLFTFAGGETVDLNALLAAAAAPTATESTAPASGDTTTATAATSTKKYPPGWAGESQRAIDLGHDKEAARLSLAAAITSDDEVLKKEVMHWNKLTRPVHQLRWGVGAMPDPKRRADSAGGTAGRAGSPYGRNTGAVTSGEDDDEEEVVDPIKDFDDLAGEVGSDMVKEIRRRLDKGEFGKLFEYDRKKSDNENANSGVNYRLEASSSPYGPRGPSSGAASSTTPPTNEELDAVAEQAPRGLVILGKGDRRKLLTAAAKAEVDVLLIAEMTTKNTRSTEPAIQWVVVDVATKKNVGRESEPVPLPDGGGSAYGGSFGNSSGGDAATIAANDASARRKNTAQWLKATEEALEFKDVPDLTGEKVADKVLKQAAKMVGAGGQENPLPVLLELRYYQVIGALKPEDALPLVQKLLKDEARATTFVSGTPEERKSLLENWILPVPKGPATADSDS
ncbi:MAG: DUF1559 domain-containing protein [Planctomycetia bacterium]|nr:DUF1559 domain-containing protein [Planctomycetia bacterium]